LDGEREELSAGWKALERDDFSNAERLARERLARTPLAGEAFYLLGSALLFQNRFAEALPALQEALRLAPARGVGHRLGYCHLALGEDSAAEQVLRREVQAYPDLIHAYNALGVAQIRQGKREDALAVFQQAARRDPASAEANNNVANVLSELGRQAEALPYLQSVVAANPKLADAQHNLGVLLQSLKRHDEAIERFEAALRLAPDMPYTLGYLIWNELAICRWDALADRTAALRRQLAKAIPAAPFVLVGLDVSPQEQRRCAELHVRQTLQRMPPPLWRGERYRHQKVRVAYLSADFCEHATAHLAARLFELHDRSRFEVLAVSYGRDDGSPMRKRLERTFDRFIDVEGCSDAEAARLLRRLEVDIAVDLKGHTTGARPGILAFRPAPVQVAYLGFPGTTGAPFIDYVFADRFVLPPEMQGFYSEQVVYLPDCYQVNDDRRAIPPLRTGRGDAGLPSTGVVFCCFNNSYKISPQIFAVWMRLLKATPGSVLWLLEDNAVAPRNLRSAAAAAGVEPGRLVFAPRASHDEHLARHALADLFLDTLPCNAHTTASDALWAGLPILTCPGRSFAGRVAGSLLQALELGELAAPSVEEYERLALRFAGNPVLLAGARRKLAVNRARSPLFDTPRFCRHLEAAYLAIWERAAGGRPPLGFTVR
jgi:predicted O-linked N-acetylglucosamine transferase (SPINDLY family)